MTTTRKQHSAQFKAKVALVPIRGEKTLSQLGSQFKVHPMQIAKWRKAAIDQRLPLGAPIHGQENVAQQPGGKRHRLCGDRARAS